MTDTLSASSAITWGATLSAAIESLFPAIAIAVKAGVEYDPTLLVRQLCGANSDDPAAWALRSMLQATDTALEHTVYERNVAQEQLQLRQTELQNCQSELRKKSDLCDILSTRLASLLSQPVQPLLQPSASYPKRLSKDPLPFDGEEKEIKRRQQGYINWKSQLRLLSRSSVMVMMMLNVLLLLYVCSCCYVQNGGVL